MTVHTPLTMTKEAFLSWVEQREERYEYAGGRVIMMVRVTLKHAVVTSNLVHALKSRLQAERFNVVSESFAVHIGDNIRFPDVLVQPYQSDENALAASAPLLIVEVLSPGTLHVDFGDKKREYLSLPTLEYYLVISPDEPRMWLWQRADGTFSAEPEMIEGPDQQLALPALALTIPFAEIYRAVR